MPIRSVRLSFIAACAVLLAACSTLGESGCGTGYTCKAVASSSTSTIYGRACAKL